MRGAAPRAEEAWVKAGFPGDKAAIDVIVARQSSSTRASK
jgi:hypothetical protein